MYEIPGTPKFLSVSDTWKINSTEPFYNITTFHLFLRMEVVRPVKKFWLSWCFQKPMRERDMQKCSVAGSNPSFCKAWIKNSKKIQKNIFSKKNPPPSIHLCLSLAGLYTTVLFGLSLFKPQTKFSCLLTACLTHYFTLSTAIWIACQALHLSHQPLFTNKIRSNLGILSEKKMAFVRNAIIFCHVWPGAVVLLNTQIVGMTWGRKYIANFLGLGWNIFFTNQFYQIFSNFFF